MRVRMPDIPSVRGAAGGTERRRGSLRCDVGQVRPDRQAPVRRRVKRTRHRSQTRGPRGDGAAGGHHRPPSAARRRRNLQASLGGRACAMVSSTARSSTGSGAAHHLPAAVLGVEKPMVGGRGGTTPTPAAPRRPRPATTDHAPTGPTQPRPGGTDHPASGSEPRYEGAAPQHAPARATYAPRSSPPRTDSGRCVVRLSRCARPARR